MSRILGVLLALVLTFGLAFADELYSGFDVDSGTGVLGVGQVQPPGLDTPPDTLTAERTATYRYEWECIQPVLQPDGTFAAPNWGEYTLSQTADADVKVNPKDMVLNYTFNGWVDGVKVLKDQSQLVGFGGFDENLAPACPHGRPIQNITGPFISYTGVTFSY